MIQFTSDITVELTGHYGSDADICHAAWVSSGVDMKEEPTEKRMRGLIKTLMQKKHGSPFEDGYFRFRISAPRGVRDEHVRHRAGWSFSSSSLRYREGEPLFYVPSRDRPLKPIEGFKSMEPQYENYDEETYAKYVDALQNTYFRTYLAIERMKAEGFDTTEAIRWGSPDGLIVPYIARCNPRSLMHFLSLRTHDTNANHISFPMWEIENVADQMENHFARLLPITYHFYNQFGRESP